MVEPVTPAPQVVYAEVMSSWKSQINWAAIVGPTAMLLTVLTGGKLNLTADQQTWIITGLGYATGIFIWIQRTWFTTRITKSSAK